VFMGELWVVTRPRLPVTLARPAAQVQFARPSEWIGIIEGANHLKDWSGAERLLRRTCD
jgi:hypothetical protein